MDLENSARLGEVPAHPFEDPEHDLALELVRRLVQGQRLGPPNLRGLLRQGDIERKIVELDDGPLGQDHAPLDDVLELAHVARPPVGLQRGERFGRGPVNPLVEPAIVAPDEMVDEQGHVLDPLPERRHDHRHDVEPIVEILAEGAASDGLLEVRVRGGDEPDVDLDRASTADSLDLALLEHAQELHLELGPQCADLVEEHGAPLRQLELPQLPPVGAGERALLVAEQIGLDERLGDGGRVDGDEGPVTPRALMVDGPRDQLLAGSALAGDQDGGRRPGDLRDQAVELLDRGMPTDDLVEDVRARQLGAQECDLALERPALEGAARQRQDLVLLEGLGQIVEGAELHGGHRGANGLHGGNEDHLDAFVEGLDALEHLDAVHPGQADVEEDEVDGGGAHDVERAGAVWHVDDVVVILENQPERLPNAGVVVDDEDDWARHSRTLAPISVRPG